MITSKRPTTIQYVPAVEQIARKMVNTSQIMIILEKALALGITRLLILGVHNILYLPRLAKMEFAVGIKLLCELEILAHPDVHSYILHPQMTDMALALHNYTLIWEYLSLAKRYHIHLGIATYNPEILTRVLADFPSLPHDLVLYTSPSRMSASYRQYAQTTTLKFVEITPQ
jgi:hypothetical protein